ncbi:hypothetical protein DFJ74DRAFT_385930 [Hyaloraphidium curvatum]|nr:hypothetical protein DFJ74DRAFT_385930 [Hyaloraphidium curvatum]
MPRIAGLRTLRYGAGRPGDGGQNGTEPTRKGLRWTTARVARTRPSSDLGWADLEAQLIDRLAAFVSWVYSSPFRFPLAGVGPDSIGDFGASQEAGTGSTVPGDDSVCRDGVAGSRIRVTGIKISRARYRTARLRAGSGPADVGAPLVVIHRCEGQLSFLRHSFYQQRSSGIDGGNWPAVQNARAGCPSHGPGTGDRSSRPRTAPRGPSRPAAKSVHGTWRSRWEVVLALMGTSRDWPIACALIRATAAA